MIQHLREAIGIQDYKVYFVCEPTCQEVIDVCKESNLPNYEVVVNNKLLGLWANKKKCLHIGFGESDYVVHLEDDILISKDALLFYEWCKHTYRGQQNVFNINGFAKIRA